MSLNRLMNDPDFIATVCGAGVFAVVVLIWTALMEGDSLHERLKTVTMRREELIDKEKNKKQSRREHIISNKDTVKSLVQRLRLEQGKQTNEIRLKLARAGYRSRDAVMIYLLMRLVMPICLGLLAFFMFVVIEVVSLDAMMRFLAVFAGLLLGIALPDIYLKNQSQRRMGLLRKAMPDALDLMVICAEAGLSLDATLDRVSREMAPSCAEIAEEIGLTSVELSFLPERSMALQNLADRVQLQGVASLVNTLIQTERYGTPLAQALRVLSAEMRNERMMVAETKAAKLPATLTVPMILFIMPPLFFVLLGPAVLKVTALAK